MAEKSTIISDLSDFYWGEVDGFGGWNTPPDRTKLGVLLQRAINRLVELEVLVNEQQLLEIRLHGT